jgi:hypothetical protein
MQYIIVCNCGNKTETPSYCAAQTLSNATYIAFRSSVVHRRCHKSRTLPITCLWTRPKHFSFLQEYSHFVHVNATNRTVAYINATGYSGIRWISEPWSINRGCQESGKALSTVKLCLQGFVRVSAVTRFEHQNILQTKYLLSVLHEKNFVSILQKKHLLSVLQKKYLVTILQKKYLQNVLHEKYLMSTLQTKYLQSILQKNYLVSILHEEYRTEEKPLECLMRSTSSVPYIRNISRVSYRRSISWVS